MKTKWPPIKSWTCKIPRKGYNHFVAINYGGKGSSRWVNLVSVLDGNVRLRIDWKELTDISIWLRGWIQIEEKQKSERLNLDRSGKSEELDNRLACLHPSEDSGLVTPTKNKSIREWD